jgi:uncharacterized protein YciI
VKQLFAVIRSRGPAWQWSRPLEGQEEWAEHASFMDALHAEGFVVLAGPLEDTGDALIIVRASTAGEIADRLVADPWTASGLLRTIRITPWN